MCKILLPIVAPTPYQRAAEHFQAMYAKVTGVTLPIVTEAEADCDLVVIGADDVQPLCATALAEGWIQDPYLRYGTDDYALLSASQGGRTLLFLMGARGRATLYAVYDFFERRADCHYFWDGDVVPPCHHLDITCLDVIERPRFAYRGLRYFAHSGLHRFQAEHWGFADWQRELDWLVKRRLNIFMLRIGMDDLFQRAFPADVPYPAATGRLPEATAGYDDRTLFWPLEYRGVLRKRILQYAFDLDLLHPEDCGTVTHWYSRTPLAYLERVKPKLLAQSTRGYQEQTGLVWDFRDPEMLDNYMHLTDTSVKAFGKPEIFHTIGLAERLMSTDRAENLRMKLLAYRRIGRGIRERYPTAQLWLASWDFIMYWQPDEVRALVQGLDPARTMILDYTSDNPDPDITFLHWGVMGKLPWLFGIFHAYEANSDIRGNYPLIRERLATAAADPMCQGMVLWPELSHSDTLMLEFLAQNAWAPLTCTMETFVANYCAHRYAEHGQAMQAVWQTFLPLVYLNEWTGFTRRTPDDPAYAKYGIGWTDREMIFDLPASVARICTLPEKLQPVFIHKLEAVKALDAHAPQTLHLLSNIPEEALHQPMLCRDIVDIARTVLGRRMHFGLMRLALLIVDWQASRCGRSALDAMLASITRGMHALADLLACHWDYSMNATLEALQRECPVNPDFESTLKQNLVNGYCRQYAYEPQAHLYCAEWEMLAAWIGDKLDVQDRNSWQADTAIPFAALFDRFMAMPLANMRPPKDASLKAVLYTLPSIVASIQV